MEKTVHFTAYGSGWAIKRAQSSEFSKKEREKSVISINKNVDKQVNMINRQLLSDDVDELRLYAFSLLESQLGTINQYIHTFLQKYRVATNDYDSAEIEKKIALLYWEMVYMQLTEKEFRNIIIEKSFFYATKAIKVLSQDPTLWILLSRIYTEKKDMAKAIEALHTAVELKAPASKTLPYLAEYSFKNKDYVSTRKYICSEETFQYIQKIGKIYNFWCDK